MADPIDNIVTVNIIATSAAPTRKSFGIPLVLAYHTHNTDLVRTYFNTTDMVADGFSVNEPAYLMANAIVQQNPRPPQFKVGRATTAVVQVFTFTVTDNNNGDKVGVTITSPLGVVTDCHHTVASETLNQVATAVAALLNALPDSTAAAVGPVVTFTAGTAGTLWYPSAIFGGSFQDTTPTAFPQTDLAAIALIDNQFYGVSQMIESPANIQAAAAWVEANQKILAYTTSDSDNETTPPSGVMGVLKGLSYKRSFGLFSGSPYFYAATGLMANRLTVNPGTDTWAYKQIAGAPVDILTATQQQNITGNNGNFYITIAGINATFDGRSAQGQYMDIQRGLDALQNDIQTRVFALIASAQKIPYTAKGISQVVNEVKASLASFTASASDPTNFLSNDAGVQPQVLAPDISTISPIDKQQRILRNVTFTATTTGAIQTVIINGVVSF